MKTRTKIGLGVLGVNILSAAAVFAWNKCKNESVEELATTSFNRIQKETGVEATLQFGELPPLFLLGPAPIAVARPKEKEVWFCINEKELNLLCMSYRMPKHILVDVVMAHEFGHLLDPNVQDGIIDSYKEAEQAAWRLGKPLTPHKKSYDYFNFLNMTYYWSGDVMEKILDRIEGGIQK